MVLLIEIAWKIKVQWRKVSVEHRILRVLRMRAGFLIVFLRHLQEGSQSYHLLEE